MDNFRDIYFNGRSMHSFGFYLKEGVDYVDFPQSDIGTTLIPGSRVGEEITDKGTLKNIEKTYSFKTVPCKMPYTDEGKFIKTFVDWANANKGVYGEFLDTTRKGYRCNAFLKDVQNFKKKADGFFEVDLVINRQPYWYLITGLKPIENTSPSNASFSYYLTNPESEPAYPYFKLTVISATVSTPTVTIIVNDTPLTLTGINGYIEIDSEKQQAFKGNNPKNDVLSSSSIPQFPEFKSGVNEITITPTDPARWKVECIPRWRCK